MTKQTIKINYDGIELEVEEKEPLGNGIPCAGCLAFANTDTSIDDDALCEALPECYNNIFVLVQKDNK